MIEFASKDVRDKFERDHRRAAPLSPGCAEMSAAADAATVSALLAERIETLAAELMGSAPTARGRTELRFYPKGAWR
jgi:hypothetical protein